MLFCSDSSMTSDSLSCWRWMRLTSEIADARPAMMTTFEFCFLRPARPRRCTYDARLSGRLSIKTNVHSVWSMPKSAADVATMTRWSCPTVTANEKTRHIVGIFKTTRICRQYVAKWLIQHQTLANSIEVVLKWIYCQVIEYIANITWLWLI